MLQHSLDAQLDQYKAKWTPNILGTTVCITWLAMVMKSAVFLDFVERPILFAVYFMALFPVTYCVEKSMRELHKFLNWCFSGMFNWLDDFLEESTSNNIALPIIFTTTTTLLAIGITIGLFDAASHLTSVLP